MIDLRRTLWAIGLVLIIIAAVVLVVVFAGGHRPSLADLVLLGVGFLLAAREV